MLNENELIFAYLRNPYANKRSNESQKKISKNFPMSINNKSNLDPPSQFGRK